MRITKILNYSVSLIMLSLILIVSASFIPKDKEEGMYPLAQLGSLDLAKAGLQIPQSDIYEPGKIGLTNALVRLGGCTGSFISDKGLVITNHHCVFGSVASLSSPEQNYLENGFYAAAPEDELKTTLPCRITLSFEDVSEGVLEGVDGATSPKDRKKMIADNIDRIEKTEQGIYPDLEIKISEMFVGRYYTLFRYKLLEDVRLVYVPPQAVGKFGGESDNWVWPRHNGDFSIVRVYENGEPYHPEKHLKVKAEGTNENDFVFILGYPGTTYRHAPAEFLTYQNNHILPTISSWFDERIKLFQVDAANDKAKQLRYAGTLASLSNTTKNFKGKMQGLQRTSIIEDRYSDQSQLKEFIENDGRDLTKYANLLSSIEDLYDRKNKIADDYIYLNQLYSCSGVFFAAQFAGNGKLRVVKSKQVITEDYQEKLAKELKSGYRIYTTDLDAKFFSRLLFRIHKTGGGRAQKTMDELGVKNPTLNEIEARIQKVWAKSAFSNRQKMIDLFDKNPKSFFKSNDAVVACAMLLDAETNAIGKEWSEINNELDALMPMLAEVKEQFFGGQFIPDANATLRLTYGYVKGYQPMDAVYNDPYTTVSGILQKAESEGDYYMPDHLLEKYKTIQASDKLLHPTRKQVVVGMLYNLDTTGGNSGSPILNSKGELVGINFDRATSATINDFEWNESYSRSIGVDIRYVLYVMKYISEADNVLKELEVEL